MKKTVFGAIFGCLILTFMSNSGSAQTLKIPNGTEPAFHVGQVWSYKTRENESSSTFIVLKIDADAKLGKIVHIAVTDLKMKNPRSRNGFSERIGHMPFFEKALAMSAVKLLKENADLPDFESGYGLWKEAFDQKRAGFYTVTLADAIKITEEGLNQ